MFGKIRHLFTWARVDEWLRALRCGTLTKVLTPISACTCSIEPEMMQVQFMDSLFNKCLGGWVVKTARIVIVGLVLWVQYPVEAIFFADFETP